MAEILALQSADVKLESQKDSEMKGEEEEEQYKATSDSDGNITRPDPTKLFRMGNPNDDPNFSKYTNLFVSHKHGEHPTTKKKNIDKKKYLCTKFSLMEEGEWTFEWSIAKGHNLYGSEKLQTLYVAWTIGKLLRKIPTELMHRKWPSAFPEFKKVRVPLLVLKLH
ncbi:hypothetical protein ANCDUO_04729 [Ancylostoma duodenale]|uniref:Uncharacterized protein n=1 Tax=Ancylostoma duodenale TaxID=51022 RepID=A0A0C2DQI0_9BILA|nr:hypothetical protein ANCDUO_04729 [Ancylostoma duodenale]